MGIVLVNCSGVAYNSDAMPERSRKPDINLLAKSVVDRATGEVPEEDLLAKAEAEGKNPAAVLLGHLGGIKGGKARAKRLSAEQRREIAKKAAETRWHKGDLNGG